MLAAVNPCGFALLPAYLSLFVLDDDAPSRPAALQRAVRATVALTVGFMAVFSLFGLLLASAATALRAYLPAFTVGLGVLLVIAGLWVLAGKELPKLPSPRRRPGAGAPSPSVLSMTGFGASYAVASLGCTIAPFLAVVATSFQAGSAWTGFALFTAYALGMGLVVAVAAIAVALTKDGLVRGIRRRGNTLRRLGGLVLAAAGAYVAWYGWWELRVLNGAAGANGAVGAGAGVQQWLAAHIDSIGVVGFAAALVVLLAVGLVPTRVGAAARRKQWSRSREGV